MWKLLCVFSSVTLHVICGKLVGDHICHAEESYTVNVTEQYERNRTVRDYKWCLNVPPRCSYYTIKKINETRIAEVNKTRIIEKCCRGFSEKDYRCVSDCDGCENGICKDNICHCASGFGGINCDTSCNLGLWGPNCTNTCKCNFGSCNSTDGTCIRDRNATNEENHTDTSEIKLNELSPPHENNFGTDTIEFTTVGEKIENVSEWYDNNINNHFVTERKSSYSNISDSFTNTEPVKVNVYDTFPVEEVTSTKENLTLDKYETEIPNNLTSKPDSPSIRHNLVNDNVEILIPVGIQYDQVAKPWMQEAVTSSTILKEKNDVKEENKTESNKIPSSYFINSISVSAATTVALILIAIAIVTIKRKYKTNKQIYNKKNVSVSTVAVYTTSIFHTPLPDPPTCENPSYLSQIEAQDCLSEQIIKSSLCNSMNSFKQPKSDGKNYEYDYPPSTGSYRAASIIEPLDADNNQKPNFTQTEPVYDEIPCRSDYESIEKTPGERQSNSLYMNICGSVNTLK